MSGLEADLASAAEQIEATDGADCRCVCGSLVARLVDGGVELKCRRCKRIHVVALPALDATPDGDAITTKPSTT